MPEIEVLVAPVPKARPRVAVRNGKAHAFTPRRTERAEDQIRQVWLESGFGIQPGPCYVDVLVRLARPLGHFGSGRNAARLLPSAPRWPAVLPDVDNYAKTALDALRRVAFEDDGRIVRLYLAKVYAGAGVAPGWRIGVFSLEGGDDGDDRRAEAGARHGAVDAVRRGEEHGQRS